VTLSATAAAGFSVATTYYKVDDGATQTYTVPLTISGPGDHTLMYWSVNNVVVYESPLTKNFTISSRQLTALAPAKVWIGLKNSDDVGVKFDLLAEIFKDGTLVSSGQLNTFAGGSSGFNNAHLATIALNSFSSVDFPAGSQLQLKVSVRNACVGSGHNSGV